MSIWQAYQNLPPKTKLAVGAGLLAWGVLGLQFSDELESKLGFIPTEADKAELEKLAPRIHGFPTVDGVPETEVSPRLLKDLGFLTRSYWQTDASSSDIIGNLRRPK
ncbi:hypothetical protein N657DRAFT_670389 [Parathielavia appendiculata]|uniref:Uncharacterized protein n=1 Tax=Parathielavia appendiculata TaxID=2587402 RepID=A0AAN6U7A9_9PEZI|nr:hypothetical protein N657DRAFT_670389 [Parathielavia appendiculata]